MVDGLRCVFCGYCEVACPCDAIRLDTGMHAQPALARAELICNEETLGSFAGRDGTVETSNPRGRAAPFCPQSIIHLAGTAVWMAGTKAF